MKRFLTIFPTATNIHLIKDVGMIPHVLAKEFNYDSTLLCYKNGKYDYLETEVKGLKIKFLKKVFNQPFLDVLCFLLFNSRKYDVVQVYHLLRSTLLWCLFFKLLSHRGKTYLKLDADDRILAYIPSKLIKYLLQKVDVVSVENRTYFEKLNGSLQLGRAVHYIPNGFYDGGIDRAINVNNKLNKIITIGRIGTKQKATEILCLAFQEFALQNRDWSLEIIGYIADDFKPFIVDYFERNPNLKNRVKFLGAIHERGLLEEHYLQAKIFVMTSRYEGFPLVLPEAASYGCYLISTDLPAARDMIDGGKYGKIFSIDDHAELATILTEVCDEPSNFWKSSLAVQDFAKEHFYWPTNCKNIDLLLWKR